MSNKSRNNYSKKEADKDNILRRTGESFFINQNKKIIYQIRIIIHQIKKGAIQMITLKI